MKTSNILLASLFMMAIFSSNAQKVNQGNIAVAADKMNVLYLGIDNPISIGNADKNFKNTVVTATNAPSPAKAQVE
ncbi:MAG: hypothetical protein FGM46_05975 [Ferruginibacter sp.]|nr:hypothetical protein [Ferruginibacter sp.]